MIDLSNFKHSDAVTTVGLRLNRDGVVGIKYVNQRSTGVDIIGELPGGNEIKIVVRVISNIGGYTCIQRDKFNVVDQNLFLSILHRKTSDDYDVYLIPATVWAIRKAPFAFYPFNKPGLVSKPEYGITFSQKTLEEISEYRLPLYLSKIHT